MSREARSPVFVSYADEDSAFAHQLKSSLRDVGFRRHVWLYEDEVRGGDNSSERVKDAIEQANDIVVIVSANSSTAPGVAQEIGMARALKKKIIPLLVGLRPERLPWGLKETQAVDFPQGFDLERLPRVLASLSRGRIVPDRKGKWLAGRDLYHYPDVDVQGLAAVAEAPKRTWLVYGPYMDLDAGYYVVFFDLETTFAAGDDPPVCFIDVVARHTQVADKVLAHRTLTYSDLSASGPYDPKRLHLCLPNNETDVEFRVYSFGAVSLRAKEIRLQPLT